MWPVAGRSGSRPSPRYLTVYREEGRGGRPRMPFGGEEHGDAVGDTEGHVELMSLKIQDDGGPCLTLVC